MAIRAANEVNSTPQYKKRAEKKIALLSEVVDSLAVAASSIQILRKSAEIRRLLNPDSDFPASGLDFYEARKQYEIFLIEQAY